MTNEAKPTPGPVRVFPNDLTGHCEIVPEGAVGPVIARINPFSARSEAQGWADAHLIAEAFNVHHETGLTPRQLAEKLKAICGLIPINYLQRHDAPGATGPTAALDIVSAMRDYAEDRWKLYELAKQRAELLEALEPFALIAEYDIGADESDGDDYRPMQRHNVAPRVTVGHLRQALAAIAKARGGAL